VRVSASEKLELIRLVEGSSLSVRRTLAEIGLSRVCLLENPEETDRDGELRTTVCSASSGVPESCLELRLRRRTDRGRVSIEGIRGE